MVESVVAIESMSLGTTIFLRCIDDLAAKSLLNEIIESVRDSSISEISRTDKSGNFVDHYYYTEGEWRYLY